MARSLKTKKLRGTIPSAHQQQRGCSQLALSRGGESNGPLSLLASRVPARLVMLLQQPQSSGVVALAGILVVLVVLKSCLAFRSLLKLIHQTDADSSKTSLSYNYRRIQIQVIR